MALRGSDLPEILGIVDCGSLMKVIEHPAGPCLAKLQHVHQVAGRGLRLMCPKNGRRLAG